MTPEDAEIIRMVRRELSKRLLDSTQMDVQVKAGKITLLGRVMHQRDAIGANLRAEIDIVSRRMMGERLVKGVYDQLHYVIDHSADDKDDKNPRGRMRTER